MITLDAQTDRREGVTLVRATVTNTLGTPQLVTLESQVEPTWQPQFQDSPRPEWRGGRWQGRLEAGQRRALGFATPESVVADVEPITVASTERATGEQAHVERSRVLASLEAWEPRSTTLSRSRK